MAFGRTRAPARTSTQPGPLRSGPGRPADDWLQPLPTPDVQEGGESMWDAWQEESMRMDQAFADTQPSDVIPLADASQPAPSATQGTGLHWTVETVMALARRNNRVCPRPLQWQALCAQLATLRGDSQPGRAAAGLLASATAWHATPPLSKRVLLRQQVEWAAAQGVLEPVQRFLASLQEDEWQHMED